jgi:hypothetical protein
MRPDKLSPVPAVGALFLSEQNGAAAPPSCTPSLRMLARSIGGPGYGATLGHA